MSGGARKESGAGKKFQTYNINDTYKGGRPETRTGPNTKGHGMTSLGKIQSRRMPGPSSLPSLRTECAGNDPDINLVPSNSAGWGGGGGGGGGKEKEEKEAPTREPPAPKWGSTGEHDKSGSSLPQHLQGDFPTLRDNQQQEGGRRERPMDGPPTGWGGGAPDGKQQARRGPPHQGYYPEGAHWGEQYGGPPPGQPMGPPGPYGPPPPGPHPHHHRGRGPPREGSARGAHHQMFRPYPPHRPRTSHQHRGDPRQMLGEASQDISRPCLVKEDELKSLEVSVDEDDGGWAGHHAEVDYSKEVVFDDSDEEEGDEKGRSVGSHAAWERMEDGGRRHKQSAAVLQKAGTGGREVGRLQHQLSSEDQPPRHMKQGHHYSPYEQKHATRSHYGGQELHQGAWSWHQPPRRAWDRPPEIQRRNVSSDEGDWRQGDQLMQGQADRLRQRSESASSREDLERSDDFGTETPSHAREPMKSRQQLRIMMREITDSPSPDSQVKDVPVPVTAESKPHQGWSVAAQQLPPPPQKARSPVTAKEAPTEEEQLHSPVDSIATAWAADSVATKTAWDASNRGPVSTGRRLYEPEGQASVKKFTVYKRIHDKDHNGQDKKPSGSSGNDPADTPSTPGEGKVALLKGDMERPPSESEDITPVQRTEVVQTAEENAEVESAKGEKRGGAGYQKTQHGRGRMPSRGEEAKGNAKQPGDGGRQPRGDSRRSRDRKQQHQHQDNSRHPNVDNRQPPRSITEAKDSSHPWGGVPASNDTRRPCAEAKHEDKYPDSGEPRSSFSDSRVIQESGPSLEDSRQARGSVSNLGPSQQTQRGPRQPVNESKQRHGESRRPQADSKQPHGDTWQPQADSRRYQADSRRPHGDSRRPQGDSKQSHGDTTTRQPQDDSRRSQGDSRRPHGDSRRPQGDSKQPHGDTIQPHDDSRRSQGDSRHPQGDSKQPYSDTRRPHGDSRRGQGDRQPQGDHSRGSKVAASRQPQNDLRRFQGDSRQPQPNSRGPEEDDFRETRGDSGGSRSSAHTQSDWQQSHDEARPIRGDQRQPRGDTSKAARGRRDRGRRDEPRKSQEARKQDRNDKESPAPEGRSSGGQRKEAPSQVSEDAGTVQTVGSDESRKVSTTSGRERFDPPHTQHAKDARARPLPKDDPHRGSRTGKYDHQRPPEGRDKRQENRHSRGLPSQNIEWEGEPKESARRAARQSERRPTPAAKQEGNKAVQSRGKPRDYPAAPEKPVQMQEVQQTDPVLSEMESTSVESSKQEYQQAGRGARNSSARGRGQRGDLDGSRAMPGHHEGRQRESRKPNNASTTDNRPPRREGGGRERTTRREPRHPDTVQQLKPVVGQPESAEIGKEHESPREGVEVTITDSAASAKSHDVAQMYDLSSPQVFVVDQTEGPDALLSPVDDSDFTEVVSKREKRDKKEKKDAPRRSDDSYNSQQRGARKGGVHGSREEVSSSRSQAKQGSHAPLGPRGRGRQTVDGAKVPGPRAHGGGGGIVSQWEATYSKSVSGAQMSPNPVLPETELTNTLAPLSGGQVPTTPSPSPGVIGSGIPSPTSQNTSKYMFGGSGGRRTHALGEVERQADSGNYTLFSGLSGDMFHSVVSVSRSDVTQSKESRRSPAAPADPGRILGKAIQDTIQQEHPKTAQQTSSLKQPQLQQTDAGLVLQAQAPRGFTEIYCVSEDQGQPQQSSSERPQQEAGRPAPGRGRGLAAGRTPGPRTTNAPGHRTGSHGSDRGTTEGQGANPASVSEPQSHHTQMPAPHLPATSTSSTVQDSSDSVQQTRDSRDKLKLAEESNASRMGPPTTYQGGQKDGVREFNQSTAPEDGARGLELNTERSQDKGSRGELTTEGVSSGGFTSYASAVRSDSRPSSAASTASNEGQKLFRQLEISAPSHQEAPSGLGEMKQAGICDSVRVEDDSELHVTNDVGEVDIDLCLDLEVMGPALLQPLNVCEPCDPNEAQMALARLSSKPVAHVKPQQPVVKAGPVSALDVTFPSAGADISLPTMEALQRVPPIEHHHLHSSPAQLDDLPQTALEPAQGDVPGMVPATPEACTTDSRTASSVTQYQVNVDRRKLAVQVEKAGVRPAHHPSPIPLYLSPMDRVPSVSSLPECEQAAVEGHSEQTEDHEELLQAVEGTEDDDLVSKQLRVSASPFFPSEATSVPAKEDQVSSMGGVPEHSVQPVLGADPVTSVTDHRLLPPSDPSQPPSVPQVSLSSLHSHSSSLTQQQRLHQPVEPSPAVRMVIPTHLHAAAAFGISHPLTVQSHPHLIQPHPHSMQQHPHSVQPHLQSVQAHPPSIQPHPPSVQPLPQQTFPLMGHMPYHVVNPLAAARPMDQQLNFGYLQSMAQPPARGPHPHSMALLYGAAPTAPQGLNLAALPPAMLHHLLMLSQQHKRKVKEEGATFVSAPTVDPGFAAKMRAAAGQGIVAGGRPMVLHHGYMATLASGAEGHQEAASLSRHASAAQQQPTLPAAMAQPGVAFGSSRSHRPSHPQQKQPRSPLLPTPAATASITQSSIWSPTAQAPQQQPQQNIQPAVECSLPSEVAGHTTTN